MQRSIFCQAIAVLGLLLVLAGPAVAREPLRIEGTGDSQQLLRMLARSFEAANPDLQVEVPDSIGSSGGVRALLNDQTDLARIARPLKARERAQAADLQERVVALSPVVFAANLPTPCLEDLTSAQLLAIFSGTIANWAELGSCPAHKIYVALREEGDSSRTVIEQGLPSFAAIAEPAGRVVYSTPEAVQILTETPYTIGYLPQAMTIRSSLQVFALNGVAASPENVRSGAYPLVTPLGLAWKGELTEPAARFLAFVTSPKGAEIIRSAGLVPAAGQ